MQHVNKIIKVVRDNKGKKHTATTLATKFVQIWEHLSSRAHAAEVKDGVIFGELTDSVGVISRCWTVSFRCMATRQSVSISTGLCCGAETRELDVENVCKI